MAALAAAGLLVIVACGQPVSCTGIAHSRACHAVNWVMRLGSSATSTVPSASTPSVVTVAKPRSYGSWSPVVDVHDLDHVAELRRDVAGVDPAARGVGRERGDLAALEPGDRLRRRGVHRSATAG